MEFRTGKVKINTIYKKNRKETRPSTQIRVYDGVTLVHKIYYSGKFLVRCSLFYLIALMNSYSAVMAEN